jgi:hypothetical protein
MMIDKTWFIWSVLLTVSFAAGAWIQKHQPPGYAPDYSREEDEESDSPTRGMVDASSAFYSSEHEYHFSNDDDLFND